MADSFRGSCCSVLQCVAVCCSMLQCTPVCAAVCCTVLQLQYAAVCCSVLECYADELRGLCACVSALVHRWDKRHSYVGRDSFICGA